MVNKYRNVQICVNLTQHTEIFMFNYIMKVLEKEVWSFNWLALIILRDSYRKFA